MSASELINKFGQGFHETVNSFTKNIELDFSLNKLNWIYLLSVLLTVIGLLLALSQLYYNYTHSSKQDPTERHFNRVNTVLVLVILVQGILVGTLF